MYYIVTNRVEDIGEFHPIILLCGTIPGWELRRGDEYLDGTCLAKILKRKRPRYPCSFVTPKLTYLACLVATLRQVVPRWKLDVPKLEAIALLGDGLDLPQKLEKYREYATEAISVMESNDKMLLKYLERWNNLNPDPLIWDADQQQMVDTRRLIYRVRQLSSACDGSPWEYIKWEKN